MAAGKDLELKLRITADGKVAVQQLGAVDKAVDGVGDSAQEAAAPIAKLDNALAGVGKALAGLGLGIGAREIIAMAESFGQLQARLKLATEGFGDSAQAMADVQRIADSTGSSLSAVGDLYTKTAGAAKSLGLSQEQVATVTETVSQAMKVAGASGAAAEGALTQFSQALASGVLRGEEFNSVYEAAPYLIDQLAKGLGVATEDMRALANEGQLSARSVADALVKQSGAISAAYGQLPDTVGQADQLPGRG